MDAKRLNYTATMNGETLNVSYLGLNIEISRAMDDGKLVVDIATYDLPEQDTVGEHDVPRMRVWVNEALVSEDDQGADLQERVYHTLTCSGCSQPHGNCTCSS